MVVVIYYENPQIMRELVLCGKKLKLDSKTLVDLLPRADITTILNNICLINTETSRISWFKENFELPHYARCEANINRGKYLSINEYIVKWYDENTICRSDPQVGSSLIPLPFPYVVPGGRFEEMYYWDSFFTSLGLQHLGKREVIVGIVKNMTHLINMYGFVPNGNRTYYLDRSQPPFYLHLAKLVEDELASEGVDWRNALKKERAWWKGRGDVYFGGSASPRFESFSRDVETIASGVKLGRTPGEVAQSLRAGAESGWDFSSRWLKDPCEPSTISTADITPVDLRSLIYMMDFELDASTEVPDLLRNVDMHGEGADSLALVYPLFAKTASTESANRVAELIKGKLLKKGGLLTTNIESGQQWDAPNGWAPLQWLAVQGFMNYGLDELAVDIAQRWISTSEAFFDKYGVFAEKYDVLEPLALASGGEYELQEGFGWSIGVYLDFKQLVKQPTS